MVPKRVTLKNGAHIPDLDHVVRHVPWNRLRKDDQDHVLGILPQALALREGEEYLSVNWLEYFAGNRDAQLVETKKSIASGKKVGAKSGLSIAKVTDIKSTCKMFGKGSVRIAYAPDDDNVSHSAIYHLHSDDLKLLGALVEDVFVELVSAGDIA